MQNKWWTSPIRAVTIELPAVDIKTLSVKEIVDRLASYGVNMINAFAISYWPGGAAYYQSRIAPRHPDLGDRDILAEVIDEAHKHNIKVVAYVNCLWGDKDLYEKHPDWAQRGVDGKPTTMEPTYTSVAMCPNSPYRDYFLNIVKEISDNYNVDGFYFDEPCFSSWCNCANCRDLFRKRFGEELPQKAKWSDSPWQDFIYWRYNVITNFKKTLYEKSKKDNRAIFFQHPFPLSLFPREELMMSAEVLEKEPKMITRFTSMLPMARWQVPQIYGAKLQDVAEFEDIVHFELYRRVVQKPLWWYGVCARLGRSVGLGKPVLILNMQGHSPFDLLSLPEAELKLAIGEIIANNAHPLFAMYYIDVADKRGWEIIDQRFRELREYDEYLTNSESVKFAAVLYSQKTTDRFDSDVEKTRHTDCLMGVCKALLQEHLLFDVITEKQLKQGLKDYKVLILPNVRCMSEDERETVRKFVENGGGLVATGETSLYYDGGGIQAKIGLGDVFGANYMGSEKVVSSLDSYMQIKEIHPVTQHLTESALTPSAGTQPVVSTSGEAKALATLIEEPKVHYAPLEGDTSIPTIIVNQYGKGRVVYFPGSIGDRYLQFGVYDHRGLISEAVKWTANVEPLIKISNCPDTVELTANSQANGDRFVLQLVNSIRGEIRGPITHVSCEPDIQIDMQVPEELPNYKVTIFPDKVEAPCEKKKGLISFKIPKLKYHKIVVVEKVREVENV